MSSKKKELYLGKSLKDLNAVADKKNVKKITEGKCRMYTRSAEKVYQNAVDAQLMEGDAEKAYVLYMTFLSIAQAIRKTAEYKKAKNYYDDMLLKKTMKAMDEAEVLSNELKKRYEEKEALEVINRLDSLDLESKKKPGSQDEDAKESTDDTKAEEEKAEPSPPQTEQKIGSDNGLVSVSTLYGLLTDGQTSVLILDVRAQHEYDASHIMHRACISVPPSAVKPGCLAMSIEANIPVESKDIWKTRDKFDFVIIVDWYSSPKSFDPHGIIQNLKNAIYKWEQEVIIRSEPLLLEGGYQEWISVYPTMSTNPHVQGPITGLPAAKPVTLDQISYDLDMNFLNPPAPQPPPAPAPNAPAHMNNQPTNQQPALNNRPQIPDRSNKPNSVSNGPLTNNQISMNKDSGQPMGSSATPIKRLNNDLKGKKTANLDEMRRQLENGGVEPAVNKNEMTDVPPVKDIPKATQVAPPQPKIPSIPNRTLKPQATTGNQPNESHVANAAILAEQAKINEQKEELERERKEWEEKVRNEKEQYERLREMKMKEAKETADLMRKKREVEGSLNAQSKPKPDSAEAEKSRLARLQKEEEEEEERARIAQQRLKTELEAEQKQKELDEEHRRIAEKERVLMEQIKLEERKAEEEKRLNEEKEKLRKEQKERERLEREAREKREQEIRRQEDAEKRRQLELAHAEKLRQAKIKAEQERVEMERIEKQRLELERAAREKAEREKAEAARLQQLQKEDEAKKAAAKVAAASQHLPAGWGAKLDPQTGNIFYLNHMTQKTQWDRPALTTPSPAKSTVSATSTPKTYRTSLRDEADVAASGGGGLKRSYSSPNIAKMMADEETRGPRSAMPTVDRGAKPQISSPSQLQAPAKIRHFDGVWGVVGSGLTGLKNMGNTCYMNSTLQCLSNTAFLTTYLISENYLPDINRENKMGTGGEVAEEFAVLVKQLWSAQYRSITPRDFKYSVARNNSTFAGYDQQDSQEFLLALLDSLHEDLNKIRKRPKLPEQKNDGVHDATAGETAWSMHKTVHDSVIVDLFQGQYKSTVMCNTCGKKSVTFDTFMYLSLDIPSQSKCSLHDCLMQFSKEEKMSGDSRWNCPLCKVKRDAVKRIVIWKLPPIVIIVLKRFYYKGMWRQKISTAIDYPLDNLDLNKYVLGPTRRKPYDLYAVSNHYGTMEGGHYTAFAKNPKKDKWYKFDDHEVYEYSKSSVKSPAAYFLFYTSIANRLN